MTPQELLKQTRLENKMTLEDMAVHLRFTVGRLSQIENGDPVTMDHVEKWEGDRQLPPFLKAMVVKIRLALMDGVIASLVAQSNVLHKTIDKWSVVEK